MYICTKLMSTAFLHETGFTHIFNKLQQNIAYIGVAQNHGDSQCYARLFLCRK